MPGVHAQLHRPTTGDVAVYASAWAATSQGRRWRTMPSSHPYQLNEITEIMLTAAPSSVLDVGVGFGKFGVLAREYLELWDGRKKYGSWQRRVDGIEVFESYLTPLHDYIYDHVYRGDALAVMPGMADRTYDLVLLIDVLEHFEQPDGVRLIHESLRVGRNVLVSTPLDIGRQDAAFDNVFETHRFQWTPPLLGGFGPHFFVPNVRSIIWFCGEDANRVEVERPSVAPAKPKARAKAARPPGPGPYLRVRRRLGRIPALHALYVGLRDRVKRAPPSAGED